MHIKNRAFPPTTKVWTLIRHAGNPAEPRSQQAFATLYEQYSYPLYAQLRAWGNRQHDAEDLIQGFFVYANECRLVDRHEPERGRFRTFLTTCLKHFRAADYRHRTAQRRGGGQEHVPFDGPAAEARYAADIINPASPDKILEQKLAEQLAWQALRELEAEAVAGGKGELFAALSGHLGADQPVEKYRVLATRFNQSIWNLKSQAGDWRRRLREIFESLVEPLVDDRADVKSEIIALEDALGDDSPPPAAPQSE